MSSTFEACAPIQAVVITVRADVGQTVAAGEALVILEAMKMEHVVAAEQSGVVRRVLVEPDAMVGAGDTLLVLERAEHIVTATAEKRPRRSTRFGRTSPK